MTRAQIFQTSVISSCLALLLAYGVGKSARERQIGDAVALIHEIGGEPRMKHDSFEFGIYSINTDRGNFAQVNSYFGQRTVALVGYFSEREMREAMERAKRCPKNYGSLEGIEIECVPVGVGPDMEGPFFNNSRWRLLITIGASVRPTSLLECLEHMS